MPPRGSASIRGEYLSQSSELGGTTTTRPRRLPQERESRLIRASFARSGRGRRRRRRARRRLQPLEERDSTDLGEDRTRLRHRLARDLVATLDGFNVPEAEKQELLGVLGPMRGEIVEQESAETGTALPDSYQVAPALG